MTIKRNKPNLSRRIMIFFLLTAFFSISLLGFFWIQSEYSAFRTESESMRVRYLNAHKDLLKTEVNTALSYIEYQKARVEPRLKQSIQGRVNEAYAIALNIFNLYREKRTPAEIQEMVKDALRPIRFNEDRGYYFAFNLQGIETLFADRPEMEGKDMLPIQGAQDEYVVRDMLDIVKSQKEGFYQYTWTKPNKEGHFSKIAFVKMFEPFGWVLGTGEYLDDVEGDIQEEVIEFIEKIRFGRDGYVFVGQWDGVSLTRPAKGRNMWDVTDSLGTKIVQEMIRLAKEGSGYLEYVMPKLDDKRPAPKLSYTVGIPEWKWYVGTGIYIDEIETAIAQRKKEVDKRIIGNLVKIAWVLGGIIGSVCLAAFYVLRKARKNLDAFTVFFKRASFELDEINPDEMNYAELQNLAHSANDMVKARKRAGQELARAHEVLKTILERSPFGVVLIGRDRKVRWANRYICTLAGVENATVFYGKECGEYLCPTEQNACPILDRQQVIDNSERILRRKDGLEIPILKTVMEIEMNGEQVLLETFVDITERKVAEKERERLQMQLIQAQKMEAVGQLAGGVAHDFNNMLGVIIGYSELILEQVDPTQQFHAELMEIQKAAHRSADLTRQLLTFARKQTVAPQVLDLNQTVEGMLNMLRRLIGENINLIWMPGNGLWLIKMDPSQIDQILANLCVNARDAIAGVGKITVETENTPLSEDYCVTHAGSLPGEYVRISVSDTGNGMDTETLAHIFEPFFTTKGVGEGTGLGLATVYGAVKQNNGFINASSEPGRGTTFTIYIPRYRDNVLPAARTVAGDNIPSGTETILLVEDEPMILKMTTQMLVGQGYHVLGASSPWEAIRLAKENIGSIDLLMTDVIMPEMNGRDLVKQLFSISPNIKCLFMSGYTASVIAHHGVLDEGVHFIQKPFSMSDLGEKLREALKG
jgi:PAS domain S-box-containing protein